MNEQTLTNRIVGGLSYLAVLFLPVLFPLIVWIVARQDNPPLAHHGKVAFWTQLAPFLVVIVLLVVVGSAALFAYNIVMAVLVFLGRR